MSRFTEACSRYTQREEVWSPTLNRCLTVCSSSGLTAETHTKSSQPFLLAMPSQFGTLMPRSGQMPRRSIVWQLVRRVFKCLSLKATRPKSQPIPEVCSERAYACCYWTAIIKVRRRLTCLLCPHWILHSLAVWMYSAASHWTVK